MIVRKVKLINFKNFKEKEVFFEPMTFIKGRNGSGKTTLALESLLFALYGYTPKESLKDLPTRNIAKSCTVEVELFDKGTGYKVIRSYPTKLTIIQSNKILQFANNTEAQSFINSLFGDRLQFMKFRMIDAYTKETNFLEEGQTTLKRIIFSLSEDIFNNMRNKLTQLKHEREIYNKDKAVIYHHYPSKKRLSTIISEIGDIELKKNKILQTIREFELEQASIERIIGKSEGEKEYIQSKKDKLLKNTICYACKQSISENIQKNILTELGKQILKANEEINSKKPDLENTKEIVASQKQIRENLSNKIRHLSTLKMKLEARMKQIEYKYTDRDVLIAKTAITELDKLSTYYLTESIKVLEPIINNILIKINFEVKFNINDKGKFTITLTKDNIDYKYKDLSTGEKLILQTAFKLALLLERGEEGIVIADEGMSSLDKENLLHILNIFENLPFQLIFVIHNLEEVPENIKIINLDEEK